MKKYFVTGLLIWLPLAITWWVLSLIVSTMDQTLLLLPEAWQPRSLFGLHVPGMGVLLSMTVVLITGLLAANIIGQRMLGLWEASLTRIPVVKSIYHSVKQVSDTLLSSSGQAFRKAVLIEYPRSGMHTIAFVTGTPGGDVANHLREGYVSVYVPTTPNPTSGFFVMLPREQVIELDMSVDAALRYVVSMGVAAPATPVVARRSPAALP
ncbi:MAG: DUF502 domain-containing protein [Burkholderiales bacterium]|nr:DUF502 domain-containing protein [Burkholderiales bacterium]